MVIRASDFSDVVRTTVDNLITTFWVGIGWDVIQWMTSSVNGHTGRKVK